MAMGSIDSLESFGLVDGPGIRAVIFLNGCHLRCKYCHNPETWEMKDNNIDSEALLKKILRFKPYFKRNNGGVTFSGGEPLIQTDFLIEMCKLLKKENIHVAIDTAGVGNGRYEEILENVDLILLDIKHTDFDKYRDLTGQEMTEFFKFITVASKMNKKIWIRQVIVPGIHDNHEYIVSLAEFLNKYFIKENIENIDFLPYHTMGIEKYKKLSIPYRLDDVPEMNPEKCKELYQEFLNIYNEK